MDITIPYDRYYSELGKKTGALYQALREAIVEGTLAEGMRLPASRKLAGLYGLTRGAVGEAYDMLLSEGFVRTRTGSGTFVAYRAAADKKRDDTGNSRPAAAIALSDWAKRLGPDEGRGGRTDHWAQRRERIDGESAGGGKTEDSERYQEWGKIKGRSERVERLEPDEGKAERADRPQGRLQDNGMAGRSERLRGQKRVGGKFAEGTGGAAKIDFGIGQVDPDLFPVEEWKTAMFAEIREMTRHWHTPAAEPEGYWPLREAIARELRRERGIRADASQLVLTSGSAQAIMLLTLLLVEPGTAVVLENPGYDGTRKAVRAAGGEIIAAPVDDSGIVPADWAAQLLFVTPTRHFPSGAVLAPDRKAELLDWASRRGAVIVEDDYDSELRWGGRPSEPLKALDKEDRVVYVGTFSKTMYPGLRIGYALLPESLAGPFRRAKALFEPRPSGLAEQRALANFIAAGGYARNMRRMRRICGRRLIRFRSEMEERMAQWFRLVPTDAGLHLYARWLGAADEYDRFAAACAAAGVRWTDGSEIWLGEPQYCSALFGFAHLPEERIAIGVARMEAAAKALFC